MARIEKVTPEQLRNSVDNTILKDRLMPKSWKCPHCGRRNKSGQYADEILLEHGKYLEHCGCGYVHSWELELTDEFKKSIVKVLLEGKLP